MLTLPPLSLYIHVPWCVRKCPYCDFNSHENESDELPEDDYITALLDDLKHDLKYVQRREIQSIFIGGGTPSLLSAKAYERLFEGLQQHLTFASDIEITLEANPGTAEREKFADYFLAGINRLSLGVQSFSPEQLQNLGRIHDSHDAERAIEYARNAGFKRLNIDIMYGLQQQAPEQALADLERAIGFDPEHISWYQLTIEPNTAFYKQPPPLPAEDTLIDMQDAGLALLEGAGYQRYEISAFAKQGEQARHNINYWQFGDYLGIGAGAHAKLSQPHRQRVLRLRKRKQPGHYLAAAKHSLVQESTNLANRYPYLADASPIEAEELPLEYLLNALRLREGFTKTQFEQRTGLPYTVIADKVSVLQKQGLMDTTDEQVTTTIRGYHFLNSVLGYFV
ncbi:radical SAM family heme chaperone HemW [Pseudohongiella sp. SYSU M77423]|uniref:radical SAM family heme chaperone HemW n=1 Tax=Pseudohongiella sp. SYSU M77423 TaxID=3042312 RepID=UPI0024805AFF|nr:radical SAM family heme chaperone HemW [Pseudohongiella sp. SYSU M77423]MDH7944106.1 radical SAM family heme chaperone HemW [Pseudohongiella sp. SYSU M77423]MEC8859311.1 radical SAM family heme chaperone HemW [Pseudomonadota bacterium]